jgi:signal transduction histidine kinase
MLEWAIESIALSAVSLALFVLAVLGVALVIVWVGIPLLIATLVATQWLADYRRQRIGRILGTAIESPYLRLPRGNVLTRFRAIVSDPARLRDVAWLLVDGTIGLVLAILATLENLLDLIFWWLPAWGASQLHAVIDRALLSPSERSRLRLRVQQLTESRAETVDTQAAELRRIERDLHDGAQARLVALGMSLAMAEDEFDRDPASARALLAEARGASSAALEELRDLVRGIHPPVLADRGLVGAAQSLALAAPLQVTVHADVAGQLPAPVESAAYFVVAEALTNVVKHATAQHAEVTITHAEDRLHIVVRDDGVGGADPARGTGLRGIQRRLSAFDGTLTVESPPGGPTVLVMVLPCVSSSPKILPSSGTA